MNPSHYALERDRHDAHHGWILTLTFLCSIGLHLFLVFWVGDRLLTSDQQMRREQIQRIARERSDAFRVEPLSPEPDVAAQRTDRPPAEWGEVASEALAGERPVDPAPALLIPPPMTDDVFVGDVDSDLGVPDTTIETPAWEPRQVIHEIVSRRIPDEIALLPRREIPRIERVGRAPDYVPPFDLQAQRFVPATVAALPPAVPDRPEGPVVPVPGFDSDATAPESPRVDDRSLAESIQPVIEAETETPIEMPETVYEAVEQYLAARTIVYRAGPDPDRVYFRVEVVPRADNLLPTIPKDVLFVQDASASIAEQRLHFCRRGLTEALELLNPEDRFNILTFAEQVDWAFPEWRSPTPENQQQARTFIQSIRSGGGTDLYASMRALLDLPRQSGRPVIAVVVTDGRPNVGLTASSDIISEFSRLNNGEFSVYALGTQQMANRYLLELLSYFNRGHAEIVRGGRWGITHYIGLLMERTRRPQLDNLRFSFDAASNAEVFPVLSANLFADQPLVFYGSCPADTPTVVFQVRGESPEIQADMLFVIDMQAATEVRDEAVREHWARRKLYALIGQYAQTRERALLREMRRLGRQYRIDIPYAGEF